MRGEWEVLERNRENGIVRERERDSESQGRGQGEGSPRGRGGLSKERGEVVTKRGKMVTEGRYSCNRKGRGD